MATATTMSGGPPVQGEAVEEERVIAVRPRGTSTSVKTSDCFCLDPEFWDSFNITTTDENGLEQVQQVHMVVKYGQFVDMSLLSSHGNDTYVVSLTDTEITVYKNGRLELGWNSRLYFRTFLAVFSCGDEP